MNINDYVFNEKCKAFLKSIEKDFGESIIIEEKKLADTEHGFSKVSNGVPITELNVNEIYKEQVIIHEAYHHRLKFDGMPNIGFNLYPPSNSEDNRIYLDWFAHLFWDKIIHHYFYPKIKTDLDIDPYFTCKKELDNIISANEIKGLTPATKELALAGYILQVWVETNDLDYLDRFKNLLKNKYNSTGINKGERLIELFKNNPLNSFNDCVKLFKIIFNFLHLDQGIKIMNEQKEIKKCKKHTENFVFFTLGT
jgi:hypothetical protein